MSNRRPGICCAWIPVFMIFLHGCGFRESKIPSAPPVENVLTPAVPGTPPATISPPSISPAVPVKRFSVGFSDVYNNVILKNCSGCHNRRAPFLVNYQNVVDALPGIEMRVFKFQDMPPAAATQLTASQLALLKNWIDAKAPHDPIELTDVTPAPSPQPTPPVAPEAPAQPVTPVQPYPTWSDVKKAVVDVSCASCHDSSHTEGRPDFSTVKNFKASLASIVYATLVTQEPTEIMPPPPHTLTAEQKKVLADWLAGGLNEN